MKIKRKFVFAHMAAAFNYAALSHCKRLKVGSVLVKDNNPVAFGYNGRPSGEPNVGETEDGFTHPDVIHAEANAYKKLTRSTISSENTVVFCTDMCCKRCAIDIVDAGSTTFFFERKYRDVSGIRYLLDHYVDVYEVDRKSETIYRVQKNPNSSTDIEFIYMSPVIYPELHIINNLA